jgi:hypothetical protein
VPNRRICLLTPGRCKHWVRLAPGAGMAVGRRSQALGRSLPRHRRAEGGQQWLVHALMQALQSHRTVDGAGFHAEGRACRVTQGRWGVSLPVARRTPQASPPATSSWTRISGRRVWSTRGVSTGVRAAAYNRWHSADIPASRARLANQPTATPAAATSMMVASSNTRLRGEALISTIERPRWRHLTERASAAGRELPRTNPRFPWKNGLSAASAG